MRAVVWVVVALLLAGAHVAAQDAPKDRRDWQMGTWGDTERVSQYAGSAWSEGGSTAVNRVSQVFLIHTPERWYVASQRLRWRWSKPVPMTVNAPVRFAIEGNKLYAIGEDDKEYELKIEKKGLTSSK